MRKATVVVPAGGLPVMSGWIPVSERLPESFAPVWIWEGELVCLGWWDGIDSRWVSGYRGVKKTVTHWQPLELPAPPVASVADTLLDDSHNRLEVGC